MKLEDFVAETIRQVVAGVKAAQQNVRENDGIVNPLRLGGMVQLEKIVFDVAVTTTEGTETRGGAGIFVGPLALGTSGRAEATAGSVSRIQFAVPVELPGLLDVPEYSARSLRKAQAQRASGDSAEGG